MQTIFTLEETKSLIRQDKALMIAGDESLLRQLPEGNWIGGTTAYFIGDDGGVVSRDSLCVVQKTSNIESILIEEYDQNSIKEFTSKGFDSGVTFIIIPAFSDIHKFYAENAMDIEGIFDRPVAGWVSGVHLEDISEKSPKVINGKNLNICSDKAIVAHLKIKSNCLATMDIVNLFKQNEGDVIKFPETSFSAEFAFINGKRVLFSKYLKENNIDTRLPLVADFNGAMINVSFQDIDEHNEKVSFYAPVFKDVEYYIAEPIPDYVATFEKKVEDIKDSPYMSVNCILNFLYASLEGKQTGEIKGPITFGEIAYLLINQTMVHVSVK